jgi:cell division protein FtsW (lipid II flippase)
VHAGTVVTSLLILGLVLYKRRPFDDQLDLAAVIASATLASPVAWEHHYGSFLPLFALALPACLGTGLPVRKLGIVLGLAFLAMGFALRVPDSFFNPPWLGWTASHLFFGALLFLGLLVYLRRRPAGARPLIGANELPPDIP